MAKPAKEQLPKLMADQGPRRQWRPVQREPERVSAATLAAHLDMTRQNISRLTAEGILERTSTGYLLDDSRRRYIWHLREEYRRSPRALADADLQRHKARLLEMKVAREARETMLVSDHNDFVDEIAGLVLTELSGWPARVAGNDMALRRRAESVLFELRVKIADLCNARADAEEQKEPA